MKYLSPAERLGKGSCLKYNYNDLVKGSSTKQKLQNSKGYTESRVFASTGANYFRGEVCRYKLEVN